MPLNQTAIAALDQELALDPERIEVDGTSEPAELVYARRMSEALATLYPDASDALRLAVRAQHLGRWRLPRSSYPSGRAGYHRWRSEAKRRHAARAGEILVAVGLGPIVVQRVEALIRKEGLGSDPEAQALEDAACIVFLRYYADDFASRHDDEQLVSILTKTWRKMSPRAHEAARDLALSSRLDMLLHRALAADTASKP